MGCGNPAQLRGLTIGRTSGCLSMAVSLRAFVCHLSQLPRNLDQGQQSVCDALNGDLKCLIIGKLFFGQMSVRSVYWAPKMSKTLLRGLERVFYICMMGPKGVWMMVSVCPSFYIGDFGGGVLCLGMRFPLFGAAVPPLSWDRSHLPKRPAWAPDLNQWSAFSQQPAHITLLIFLMTWITICNWRFVC